jgi:DNA repair photolyase
MAGVITVKTILNKTKRRDPWFLDEYTINPYGGCSFNCLFCYIRGSKYGEHMEEKLSIKINAAELLDKQLGSRVKKGQYGIIVMSSATDPYLHIEKETQLTRRLLEIIHRHRFPVHVITRSPLITRDIDLLRQIGEDAILPEDLKDSLKSGTIISFSFSTVEDNVAHIFEPGAPPPSARLQALKTIIDQGFHAGVSMMPLLPYINDTGEQLERMFNTFSEIGIKYIFPAGLTLHGHDIADSRTLVFRAVEKHYPHLLGKYHRLFGNSNELPAYYKNAFSLKAKQLCDKYGIPNRIA